MKSMEDGRYPRRTLSAILFPKGEQSERGNPPEGGKHEKRKNGKHSGGHDPGNALETVAFATSLTHASRRAAKPGGFFEGKMRTSFEQTASLLDGPFSF